MMFTRQRVLTLLCGFLLVGSLVFYFYKQNTSPPEPIKIYKTTPMQTESTPPVAPSQEHTHKHSHGPSGHAHSAHPSETEDSRSGELEDSDELAREMGLRTSTADTDKTVSSTKEGISEEEATLWVQEQFEMLGKQMVEKYPEIAQVTELTPNEFHELYPTDEAKDAILELALQAKDEFLADFRESFFMLPSEVRESVLDETWKLVENNWGAPMADTIITNLRAEIGM